MQSDKLNLIWIKSSVVTIAVVCGEQGKVLILAIYGIVFLPRQECKDGSYTI